MQVLIAEDSPVYQSLVSKHLRDWGFNLTIASTGSEAWRLLQRTDCPKVVLLDWVLPEIDGIELCGRVRLSASEHSQPYVIMLTGKDDNRDMQEAMRAGADDYLTKPFQEMELKTRLLLAQRIIQLQEDLVAARDNTRFASTHDSLTGLMNRGEVLELLHREIERAKRDNKPVSLILTDIDGFKVFKGYILDLDKLIIMILRHSFDSFMDFCKGRHL